VRRRERKRDKKWVFVVALVASAQTIAGARKKREWHLKKRVPKQLKLHRKGFTFFHFSISLFL